jgi:hypothetical protein
LLIAATIVFAITTNAKAQSCDPMLNDILNWFVTEPNGPGNYKIDFNMVTNRSDGKYASYSEGQGPIATTGELDYHPASVVGFFFVPAYLQGTVRQYFSDRRSTTSAGSLAPFDPGRTDQTRVTINLGATILGAPLGQVTLNLLSWGNAQSTFAPSCQNGLMYGFVDNTMFVMSLNKDFFSIPK